MKNVFKYAGMNRVFIMFLIFSSCEILICTVLSSQPVSSLCQWELENNKQFEEKLIAKLFVNTNLKDSMQFFNGWMKGDVILTSGDTVCDEYLRYNRLIDELLWLRVSDFKTGVVYKPSVKSFILKEKNVPVAEFRKIQFNQEVMADSTEKYLQVLAEGNITLYVFRRAEILRNTNEVVRKNRYYLRKDEKLVMLLPTRAVLYSLFDNDKEKIRQIVRSNHLWIRQESHLIRAIKIFNEQNP